MIGHSNALPHRLPQAHDLVQMPWRVRIALRSGTCPETQHLRCRRSQLPSCILPCWTCPSQTQSQDDSP